MLRDTLHLERVLLGMMRGEYLVEDDDGAVSIASGEYEALAIRGPRHVRKLIIMQLRQQTHRPRLLRIIDRNRVHRHHREQHPIWEREDRCRAWGCESAGVPAGGRE